jgi:hypothetical protein
MLALARLALALAPLLLAAASGTGPQRAPAEVACVNATHFALAGLHRGCGPGFTCHSLPVAGCRSEQGFAGHAAKAAGFELIASVPASQFRNCTPDAGADAAAGKLLCEAQHATKLLQPTLAIHFSTTWLHVSNEKGQPCDPDLEPSGSNNVCRGCATAAAYRQCFTKNLKAVVTAMVSASPKMLVQCDLAEALYCDTAQGQGCMLDDPSDFTETRACQPGSMNKWGPGSCVPNIRSASGRQFYSAWGKSQLDAGCKALYWGEARMIGGSDVNNSAALPNSCVSHAGSLGFAAVINELRSYATAQGYGPTYYGPQAACGFPLPNGTDVADFVIGAQHLQGIGEDLVAPLAPSGSALPGAGWRGTESYISQWDWHDANRVNNKNELPVVLEFDNFSGQKYLLDDIRRLAATPNASRAQLLTNLWRHLPLYNPRASLAIPIIKALALFPDQSQCYTPITSGTAGWGPPAVFGAISCDIVAPAATLFASLDSSASPLDLALSPPPVGIDRTYLGRQLQQADTTASWLFQILLGRDFTSTSEYLDMVDSLPNRTTDDLLSCAGARATAAVTIVTSAEFKSSACAKDTVCMAQRLMNALALRQPSNATELQMAVERLGLGEGGASAAVDALVQEFCMEADQVGLYFVPASYYG